MNFPTATVTDSRAGLLRLTMLVTVAVLLADVASKNWAVAAVGTGYVDLGLIALTVVQNDGLAFSVGAGMLSYATVFALRLGVLAALLILALRFAPDSLRFAIGFALVLGGGLGNASDVVFRDGAVVDFISTTPLIRALGGSTMAEGIVLNLADVWILAGLALLYPLFRALGLAAQRRLRPGQRRVPGHPGAAADPGLRAPHPTPARASAAPPAFR
jgi:lipoprotein signal peptidase